MADDLQRLLAQLFVTNELITRVMGQRGAANGEELQRLLMQKRDTERRLRRAGGSAYLE